MQGGVPGYGVPPRGGYGARPSSAAGGVFTLDGEGSAAPPVFGAPPGGLYGGAGAAGAAPGYGYGAAPPSWVTAGAAPPGAHPPMPPLPPKSRGAAAPAPVGKTAGLASWIMLVAVILSGGLIVCKEELFAFGSNLSGLGASPALLELERQQVRAAEERAEAAADAEEAEAEAAAQIGSQLIAAADAEEASAEGLTAEDTPALEVDDAEPVALAGEETTVMEEASAAEDVPQEPAEAIGAMPVEPVAEPVVEAAPVAVVEPEEEVPAGPACMDLSPHCTGWRAKGQCEENPRFMVVKCPMSCEMCPGTDRHTTLTSQMNETKYTNQLFSQVYTQHKQLIKDHAKSFLAGTPAAAASKSKSKKGRRLLA